MHIISWHRICRPKNVGGIGLRKIEPLNKAYLAKLGWKVFTENNNLWVRLIKDKYLRKISFLQYKSSTNDSWIWKNILKQRELLDKGLRWKLGNGKSIRFWTDRWMSKKKIMEWL